MTPPTVNAYFDPQMNDINFPAGVLQPPLYDAKMDDAPNYGNTGATIGHEITHGFDDEGRKFDSKGNLKDWWTKEDDEKFTERAKCVREQYSNYVIVGRHQDQRRAHARRRRRRLRRRHHRVDGVEGGDPRQEARGPRRLHARAAVLHRLRAGELREHARRGGAVCAP
jgi:hypothetical protein